MQCPKCDTTMKPQDETSEYHYDYHRYFYMCPNCGYEIDEDD